MKTSPFNLGLPNWNKCIYIAKTRFLVLLPFLLFSNILLSQYENIVINEVSGDGGNIEARNDAIVELAGPPGADIGCMVITNTEWAVVLPMGTTIPADGVFIIGCEEGNNGGSGAYTGPSTGLSCDVCDFPGLVVDFDVCNPDNAAYVSVSVYTTYGFTLDNGFCGANTDGDQVILFQPDGTPHDALYWGGPAMTASNGGATTFGGAAGSCGSQSDHVSAQIGMAYTLGDNDDNGVVNDYTGTHVGFRADGGNATAVNIMPNGNDDLGNPELEGMVVAMPPGDCNADMVAYTVPSLDDPVWIDLGLSLVSCNSTHIRINDTSPAGNSEQLIRSFTNSSHADDPDLNADWMAYAATDLVPSSVDPTAAADQWQVTNHPNPGQSNDSDSWDFFYDIGMGAVEITDARDIQVFLCEPSTATFSVQVYNYQHVEPTVMTTNKAGSFINDESGTDQAWTVTSVGSSTTTGGFPSNDDGITTLTFTTGVLAAGSNNVFTLVWDDYTDCCGSGSNSTVVNQSSPHECYERVEVNITVAEPISVSDNDITCPGDFPQGAGTIDFSSLLTSPNAIVRYVLKEGVTTGMEETTGTIVESNFSGIFNLPNTLTTPIAVIIEDLAGCDVNQVITIGDDCRDNPPCPDPAGETINGGSGPITVCPGENFTLAIDGSTSIDLPDGGTIDWYFGIAGFDPFNGEGSLLGQSAISTTFPPVPTMGPAINEVLVDANANDGNGGEFIEIAGVPGTDLSCYILTDGDDEIVLPDGTTIPANGFLLIASGANTNAPTADIDVDLDVCGCFSDPTGANSAADLEFTNESGTNGEFIMLFDASGNFIDGVLWGDPDVTNANHPDGNGSEDVNVMPTGCTPPASVTTSGQAFTNSGITSTPNGESIELDSDVTGNWQNTDDAAGFTPGATNSGAQPVTVVDDLIANFSTLQCNQTIEIKGIVQPATIITGICDEADVTTVSFSVTVQCPSADLQAGDINLCQPVTGTEILATIDLSNGSGTYNVDVGLTDGGSTSTINATNVTNPLEITYSDVMTALGTANFSNVELTLLSVTDAGGAMCSGEIDADIITLTVSASPTGTITAASDLADCSGAANGSVTFEFSPTDSGPWEFEYNVNGGSPIAASTNMTPFVLPVSTAGTYQLLSVTNEAGCTGTVGTPSMQTVNPPTPLRVTSVMNANPICGDGSSSVELTTDVAITIDDNGSTIMGNSSTIGNTIWYESDPSGLPPSVRMTIELSGGETMVSPTATQEYFFIYTRADGCEAIASTTVTIDNSLCCVADAGDIAAPSNMALTTICEGSDLAAFTPEYGEADENNPGTANYQYIFLLANANGTILQQETSGDFDFSNLSAGTYDIYGLSYANMNSPNTVTAYLSGITGDTNMDDIDQIETHDAGMALCLDLDNLDSDDMMVQVVINQAATANAGNDETLCGLTPADISATTNGTGMWTGGSGTFGNAISPNTTYTPDATEEGTTVTLTWTTADPDGTGPCVAVNDDVQLTFNEMATANAGNDQTVCGLDAVSISATTNGTGMWSGGSGTFTNSSSTNTMYSPDNSELGTTVTLTWTTADPDGTGPCVAVSDDVQITFNAPATANAGNDETLCGLTPADISATTNGTGMWTGGSGTFGNAISPNTTYTPDATEEGTTVTLTWTTADPDGTGPCVAVNDDVQLTFNEMATANAGNDQTVCGLDAVSISATTNGTGMWSGGSGTFTNSSSTNTTYNPDNSELGTTVTLTWTTNDPDGTGPCVAVSDDVQITFNAPATANAGNDETLCGLTPANISAMTNGTGMWTGGSGTFGNANTPTTTYIPDATEEGTTVTLTWTTADPDGTGPCVAVSDDVQLTFNEMATANAGNDQTVCGLAAVSISATTNGTGMWSGGSGTFTNSSSTNTMYSPDNSELGTTVTLTWTTADPDGTGPCVAVSDDVQITFNAPATADAGNDETLCGLTPANISATTNGTGMWTGGSGTFGNATSPNTTYMPDATEEGTTVTLTWTTADPDGTGPCVAVSDDVQLTFNEMATANAGNDQTVCGLDAVSISVTTNGTGMWTGGSGTFTNSSSTNTMYSPDNSELGTTVTLTWTTADSDGTDPCMAVSDDVQITFNAPATANAGNDETLCGLTPVNISATTNGTGMWTGGSGTFGNATSSNTTYTPDATEEGTTVTLTWTTNDPDGTGPCVAVSDNVQLTFNEMATANAGNDQTTCGLAEVTLLAMTNGTGMWTGGNGTFDDASSPNTTYTPDASEEGTVVTLTWTTNDPDGAGPCAAVSDDVQITFDEETLADAGMNQDVCGLPDVSLFAMTNGTGMWTGGNGSFGDATNPNTIYTPDASEANSTVLLTWTTFDPDGAGPCMEASDGIAITFQPIPVFTIAASPRVCFGESTTTELEFTITEGSADVLTLDAQTDAEAVGFIDMTFTPIPESPLNITIPTTAPIGVYNFIARITNSTTGCFSERPFVIEIAERVTPTEVPPMVCNDIIHTTINSACEIAISVDHLLENPVSGLEFYYTLQIGGIFAPMNTIGNPVLGTSDVDLGNVIIFGDDADEVFTPGEALIYKLVRINRITDCDNSFVEIEALCWGEILTEDKTAPLCLPANEEEILVVYDINCDGSVETDVNDPSGIDDLMDEYILCTLIKQNGVELYFDILEPFDADRNGNGILGEAGIDVEADFTDCSGVDYTYFEDEFWEVCTLDELSGLPVNTDRYNVQNFEVIEVYKRTWYAVDVLGRAMQEGCSQYVFGLRPKANEIQLEQEIKVSCEMPETEVAPWFIVNQNIENNGTGSEGPTFADDKPYFLTPNEHTCNYIASFHEDEVIDICATGYKKSRHWTVTDCCDWNTIFDEFTQLIEVEDSVAPNIWMDADQNGVIDLDANDQPILADGQSFSINTAAFNCFAEANILTLLTTDNCQPDVSEIFNVTIQKLPTHPHDEPIFIHEFPNGGSLENDLPEGVANTIFTEGIYQVTYFAQDDCGNVQTATLTMQVEDQRSPVAICNDELNVTLTNFDGVLRARIHPEDLDDSSFDNCQTTQLLVRSQDNAAIIDNDWGAFVEFSCDDVTNEMLKVELLVFEDRNQDGSFSDQINNETGFPTPDGKDDLDGGLSATCWGLINVEDKDLPQIVCEDKTLFCDDVNLDNLRSQTFTEDTDGDGVADAYFCPPTFTGGCPNADDISLNLVVFDIDYNPDCKFGTFIRRWTATRMIDGQTHTVGCDQTITVDFQSDWTMTFPIDEILDCSEELQELPEALTIEEILDNDGCDQWAMEVTDETFDVVGEDGDGACFKVVRTYQFINWCTWDVTNTELAIVNRPEELITNPSRALQLRHRSLNFGRNDFGDEDDADPYNEIFVSGDVTAGFPGPNPPTTFTADDDGALVLIDNDFQIGDDPQGADFLFYRQYNESVNNNDNVGGVYAENYGYFAYRQIIKVRDAQAPIIAPIEDITIGDTTGICAAAVSLYGPDVQECRSTYQTHYSLSDSDGVVIQTGDFPDGATPEDCIDLGELALGNYSVIYTITDGCGNAETISYNLNIQDKKAPTAYCIHGLAIDLMPTGMITVSAEDFDAGSFDACSEPLSFSFDPENEKPDTSFTCDDVGYQYLDIWVHDEAGNGAFCSTFLFVQATNGNDGTVGPECDVGSRISGMVRTEMHDMVENVEVQLGGHETANFVTDADGMFNFENLNSDQDYTLIPEKDMNPLNGVTTFDIILLRKHILGMAYLDSPYKLIAADANRSNTITTSDIIALRKLILGITNELENNSSWRFIDADYVFPNPANPWTEIFPETILVDDMEDDMDVEFIGVKIGDLNDSAIPNNLVSVDERNNGTFYLDVKNQQVKAGETYAVDFKIKDLQNVDGYQFSLGFDPTALAILEIQEDIVERNNFGLFLEEGKITSSWDVSNEEMKALQELSSLASSQLFSLIITAQKDGQLSDFIQLHSTPTSSDIYFKNGTSQKLQLHFYNEKDDFKTPILYQNQPNPFSEKTVIGFYLPSRGEAMILVQDVSGRVVWEMEGLFEEGYQSVELDGKEWSEGVYYLKLEYEGKSLGKKLVLIK